MDKIQTNWTDDANFPARADHHHKGVRNTHPGSKAALRLRTRQTQVFVGQLLYA